MPQKNAAASEARMTSALRWSRPMSERRPQRDELRSLSVHHELRVPGDPASVGARVDVPGLEGGDLGQVEHVADVQPVPGDLDPAEAVDREVAERVRGGGCWSKQR